MIQLTRSLFLLLLAPAPMNVEGFAPKTMTQRHGSSSVFIPTSSVTAPTDYQLVLNANRNELDTSDGTMAATNTDMNSKNDWALPSISKTFGAQKTYFGKSSVTIYYFVIVVGLISTVFSMVAPITSGDCLADPYKYDGLTSITERQVDQLVWYKSIARMTGMFGTLYLSTLLLVVGYSTVSCLLLLAVGLFNSAQFAYLVPADFATWGGGSADAQICLEGSRPAIFGFMALEAVGVILNLMEKYYQATPGNSSEDLRTSTDGLEAVETTPLKD